MGKIIEQVNFNWRVLPDGDATFDEFRVGYRGVKSIHEHAAGGEGDKWYYDVLFDDGKTHRIFNPNYVVFMEVDVKS